MAWRAAGQPFATGGGGSGTVSVDGVTITGDGSSGNPLVSHAGAAPTVQRIVHYAATGAEGTDFNVPIGAVLPNALYDVFWAPRGVTNVPVLDLPNGVGDRTTSQFRVVLAAALAAGELLTFYLYET